MHRVLTIDDEQQIVDVLEKFLTDRGFEVIKAYNGQEGLDIVKTEIPISIIILDEKMPGMRGSAFLKEIRKLKKDIPVIALTGSIGMAGMSKAKKRAYNHLLLKPVRLTELLEKIEEVLSIKKGEPKKAKPGKKKT